MEDKYQLIVQSLGQERIKLDQSLSYYLYTKVSVIAECLYIATNQRELTKALDLASELKIPFLVFGAGTKIVLEDKKILGLTIKNRTGNIKIAGVKGKVGVKGIGVQEALIEVDSGVSIGKLNEFLIKQHLEKISGFSSPISTLGGALFLDPELQKRVQKITVWSDGIISEMEFEQLKRTQDIILSLVLKFKAQDQKL